MKQDRRFNGLVFVGAFTETIFSFAMLVGGIALAILAFTHIDMVNKLDDLVFFINQDFLVKFKPEFAYLFTGGGVAGIGLIFFIIGVSNLTHVNRYKVSNHRVAIVLGCLFTLLCLGALDAYLYVEFDNLTENIKYVIYAVNVILAFVVIFKILGVIVGRNEQFVSNDNNKFSFENPNNARSELIQPIDTQVKAPINPLIHQVIPNKVEGTNSNMPIPMQKGQPLHQQAQSNLNTIYKRSPIKGVQTGEQLATMRPINNITDTSRKSTPKYCPKCGKLLSGEEIFCSLCGFKLGE